MKKLMFLLTILGFVILSSCSNETNLSSQSESPKEVQMKELIQFAKDTTPLTSPYDAQSRGFWRNMINWFKGIGTSDAGGAGWARGHNAKWGRLFVSL